MSKKFVTTQKEQSINWSKAIDYLAKYKHKLSRNLRTRFSKVTISTELDNIEEDFNIEIPEKVKHLFDSAERWVTCACGNQCSVLERRAGVPEDVLLRKLGIKFAEDIVKLDVKAARKTLEGIEKRSKFLIDEMITNAKEVIAYHPSLINALAEEHKEAVTLLEELGVNY